MLSESKNDLVATNFEVHAMNISADIDVYSEKVTSADIIIAQPISVGYRNENRLSTEWIKENKKASAKILTFVPLHFLPYYPHLGYIPGKHSFRAPYWDFNISSYYVKGLSAEETCRIISAHDFYDHAFIEKEIDLALNELRRREQACNADIVISTIVEQNFRHKLLFFTHNHPTRYLSVLVAKEILRKLGLSPDLDFAGEEPLDEMIMNVYPSVAASMQTDLKDRADVVRVGKRDLPLLQYIQNAFAKYDSEYGVPVVREFLMKEKDPQNYYRKLKEFKANKFDAFP